MSSMFRLGSWDRQPSISASDRRNVGGFHLSNFSEISRRAVSPRLSTSSIMAVGKARALFSSAGGWSREPPGFFLGGLLASFLNFLPAKGNQAGGRDRSNKFATPV